MLKRNALRKIFGFWTGYLLADLTPEQQEVVSYINVLIDGKFVQELYDPALLWRGSSNQVIHKLK